MDRPARAPVAVVIYTVIAPIESRVEITGERTGQLEDLLLNVEMSIHYVLLAKQLLLQITILWLIYPSPSPVSRSHMCFILMFSLPTTPSPVATGLEQSIHPKPALPPEPNEIASPNPNTNDTCQASTDSSLHSHPPPSAPSPASSSTHPDAPPRANSSASQHPSPSPVPPSPAPSSAPGAPLASAS